MTDAKSQYYKILNIIAVIKPSLEEKLHFLYRVLLVTDLPNVLIICYMYNLIILSLMKGLSQK